MPQAGLEPTTPDFELRKTAATGSAILVFTRRWLESNRIHDMERNLCRVKWK